jgi:transposase
MGTFDARHLSAEAQGDLWRRVVRAIMRDSVEASVAPRLLGVARSSVYDWLADYHTGGDWALSPRPYGLSREGRLMSCRAATIVRLLVHCCSAQLHLPFALWIREAVQQLIARRTAQHLSVWTVEHYLDHWGFTPQKPLRWPYEQDSAAVRHWLEQDYPIIRKRALREEVEIPWADEMGVRLKDQRSGSYGRRSHMPAIPRHGRRFGCNMISTIANRGQMSLMILQESFRCPEWQRFLRQLIRQTKRKLFLIWNRHPAHQAAVDRWLRGHTALIKVFPQSMYSPELIHGKYLNQDVKTNAVRKRRQQDKPEKLRRT